MVNKDIIFRDKWIPQPPDENGRWYDKGADHDYFQRIVLPDEHDCGISNSAGCMTPDADAARERARNRHWASQKKEIKENLNPINTDKLIF